MSLAERFFELFAGMSRAYGTYDLTNVQVTPNGKKKGQGKTIKAPVTVDLWEKHLAGEQHLGIIPIRDDSTCVWGCIDIDVYADLDLNAIHKQLAQSKLPVVVCRSKSGGGHLFLFASEPIAAGLMMDRLKEIAGRLGHGTSEIFPAQSVVNADRGDLGAWLNVPYFDGLKGMRYAIDGAGNALHPQAFLDYCESKKQPEKFFETPIRIETDALPEGPPCLQHLVHLGVPEGGRNTTLFNLAVYFKKASKTEEEWQNKVLETNRDVFDPPLPNSEVQQVINAVLKKEYHYGCAKVPLATYCNSKLCRTRKHGVGGGDRSYVQIESIRKLDTEPVIWFVNVGAEGARDGGGVLTVNTDDLMSPARFAKRVAESFLLIPAMPKTEDWLESVNKAMEKCEVIPAAGGSVKDQLWDLIERFCVTQATEDLSDIARDRPALMAGSFYFTPVALNKYLSRHGIKNVPQSELAALVVAKKGDTESRPRLPNKSRPRTWRIPDNFERQTEPHELPKSEASF